MSIYLNLFVYDSKSKFLLLDSWFYDEIMDIDVGCIDFFKFLYVATVTVDHGILCFSSKSSFNS